MSISLSDLVVNVKEAEVDYPGMPDFKVKVAYLNRDELVKIRKKATKHVVNKKTRQVEEELDSDLFQDLYIKSVVLGWSGLKYKYLKDLLPVDLSSVPNEESELEYSEDNAVSLMRNSPNFDSFISETVGDLENFNK